VPEKPVENEDHAKFSAFLQKDYELKSVYLTNHFTRMWTRFNYFVAIETGLVGGKFLIPNGVLSKELAIAATLISAVWYVMGAEDRYLVRLYRHQMDQAAEALAATIWAEEKDRQAYIHVGQVDPEARRDLREAESGSALRRFFRFEWLSGWRWEPISTTRLAALFPMLVLVLWLIILFDTMSKSPIH
jgi:hypothetical protein